MSTYDAFHLNSFQDRQVTHLEVANPFAGFSIRTKQHKAKEVFTYWWHQIGYVLCPEDD
jgi:hypothetical protein